FTNFPITTPWELLLEMLLFVNLFWALVNLLPIWPLDGGHIVRHVAEAVSPRRGAVVALWISIVLASVLALHSLLASPRVGVGGFTPYLPGSTWNAILFALLAVSSWQALQEIAPRRRSYWDDDEPWRR